MNPVPPPGPPHAQQQQQQAQHHSPYSLPPDYAQTAAAALSSAPASQQHIPTPNNTAAPNGRKRKAGQPGSRGVANLTPDQLAKKRANDREAQRAIRERTKNTIESLERRIRELESQQPYQELQRALQDRDRALAECEALRQRLSAVAGIVGSRDLGQTGLNGMDVFDAFLDFNLLTYDDPELAALTAQQSPLPPVNTQQHQAAEPLQYSHPSASGAEQPLHPPMLHPDLRSPAGSNHTGSPVSAGPMYSAPEARTWSPRPDHHQRQQYHPHSVPHSPYTSHGPSYDQHMQSHQPNNAKGERQGFNAMLEQQGQRDSPAATPQNNHVSIQDLASRLIDQQVLTCPLDTLLSDFVKQQRSKLANGAPLSQVIGPDQPSLLIFVDPEAEKRSISDPITVVLNDILSKFPDIAAIPERIAVLYGMYHTARWLIHPCESTYQRLPEYAYPITESLEHKHATFHDYIPWQFARKQLALGVIEVQFEDFFVPFTRTLSINWPFGDAACLDTTATSEGSVEVTLNPTFESHLRNLENWSLGKDFANNFPQLIDASVRIEG